MKILKVLLGLFLVGAVASCNNNDDNGQVAYGGSNVVAFGNPIARDVFVFEGTGFTEIQVPFGFVKPTTENTTVTLTVDTENSVGVEGTDFTIVASTVTVESGETNGAFVVRLLEGGAVEAGKKVVFKISSDKVDTAVFNNAYTLNVSRSCTVESFLGQFSSNTWWAGPSTNEIAFGTAENSLEIVDFWVDNATAPNFVMSYDPDTFVVTFQEQSTGFVAAQGLIFARPAEGKTSRFNPCTRVLTLEVNYWIPNVGTYGDKVEVFTGI